MAKKNEDQYELPDLVWAVTEYRDAKKMFDEYNDRYNAAMKVAKSHEEEREKHRVIMEGKEAVARKMAALLSK
jgi:hypothetical protein